MPDVVPARDKFKKRVGQTDPRSGRLACTSGAAEKTLKDDRIGLLGRKTYRGKVEERFSYDNFVLPFTAGMVFILIYFAVALGKIIRALPWDDRKRFFQEYILVQDIHFRMGDNTGMFAPRENIQT